MKTLQIILRVLEAIFLLLLVVALLLLFNGNRQIGASLLTISLFNFPMFYFFALPLMAWKEKQSSWLIACAVFFGLSFSVLPIGVLFSIMNWPFGREMASIGAISALINPFFIIIPVVCFFVFKYEGNEHYFKTIGLRILFALGLAATCGYYALTLPKVFVPRERPAMQIDSMS